MGGWGSGRQYHINPKLLTEDAAPLDIRKLKSKNLLIPGSKITATWSTDGIVHASIGAVVYEDCMILKYTYNKTEKVNQNIYFTYTPCNFGGKRVWYCCPVCGRRCAIIYSSEINFACRICCDLTYKTCNEVPRNRLLIKANKLRKRIRARPGMANSFPVKPKGMHHKTWSRIKYEIRCLESIYCSVTVQMMGFHNGL